MRVKVLVKSFGEVKDKSWEEEESRVRAKLVTEWVEATVSIRVTVRVRVMLPLKLRDIIYHATSQANHVLLSSPI